MDKETEFWKDYFSRVCKRHCDGYRAQEYSSRRSFRLIKNALKHLSPGLPGGETILDIGSGTGEMTLDFVPGNTVVAQDISVPMIEKAATKGLKPVQGSAQRLSFRSGSIDRIFCIGVIGLMSDWERVVAESQRVIKPGGTAVFCTLNRESWIRRIHSFFDPLYRKMVLLSPNELKESLESHGFIIEKIVFLHYPLGFTTICEDTSIGENILSTNFLIRARKPR